MDFIQRAFTMANDTFPKCKGRKQKNKLTVVQRHDDGPVGVVAGAEEAYRLPQGRQLPLLSVVRLPILVVSGREEAELISAS